LGKYAFLREYNISREMRFKDNGKVVSKGLLKQYFVDAVELASGSHVGNIKSPNILWLF